MKALLTIFFAAAVMASVHASEKPREMRFEVAHVVPQGIIAYVYKKVPVGGGGLGGNVGFDWQLGTESALVTNYAKQGDVAEGEKFTVKVVKEGVEKVFDGVTERSLRVYRASE